jgi:hypothetical protein
VTLTPTLIKQYILYFCRSTGEYYLPHLKEILDAYRVNSEETYVLDITDNLSFRGFLGSSVLENMAILSQAETISEGATTIQLGSKTEDGLKRTDS